MPGKFFLHPDIFERHAIVSKFIPLNSNVLDVGGELNTLKRFCPTSRVTVSNVTSSDIVADARSYNFGEEKYQVVTSVDVLEHIEKKDRQGFIDNLVKTAKERVIVSAPLGTQKHIEYEKKVLKWYQRVGHDSDYLKEHIDFGLPEPSEIKALASSYKYRLIYSGYLGLTSFLFFFLNYEFKWGKLNQVFYRFKQIINPLFNFLIFPFIYNEKFNENRVRFYLIIDKL